MSINTPFCLINALLNWEEGALSVLADYLEESGFERKLEQHGGLYHRVGVALALLRIGAISKSNLNDLDMPESEKLLALKRFETEN